MFEDITSRGPSREKMSLEKIGSNNLDADDHRVPLIFHNLHTVT